MFSGIRYIFGYTEETTSNPTVTSDVTASQVPAPVQQGTEALPTSSAEATPATKLEQTLNAAATKFTEQLLPQQASIEQLQSSTNQLLPSIIEQHEEELKKKEKNEKGKVLVCGGANSSRLEDGDEADDEDDFNVESWELLDLVERAEEARADSDGLVSSVRCQVKDGDAVHLEEESQSLLCKSNSGILKSSTRGESTNNDATNDTSGNMRSRQKPKVSFEAPDLVKSKQKQKQKQQTQIEQTEKSNAAAGVNGANRQVEDVVEASSSSKGVVIKKKVPTLNYARALTSKLGTTNVIIKSATTSSTVSDPTDSSVVATVAGGSCDPTGKRAHSARASTSSWSSHDDEDDIELVENCSRRDGATAAKVQATAEVAAANQDDDNDSIISSGFSDCDYGFGAINDYVMRPKKSNGKRGRALLSGGSMAGGSRLNRNEKRAGASKTKSAAAAAASVVAPKTNEVTGDGSSAVTADAKSDTTRRPEMRSVLTRSSKPKKKRMIMSTAGSSSSNKPLSFDEFLKQKSINARAAKQQQAATSRRSEDSKNKRRSPDKPSGEGGSNESSDVADMDESWFVTPPSCFTGTKKRDCDDKADLPKAKEADRENALIENPSVYIARAALKNARARDVTTITPHTVGGVAQELMIPEVSSSKLEGATVEKQADLLSKASLAFEDESWNSGEEEIEDDVKFDDDQLAQKAQAAPPALASKPMEPISGEAGPAQAAAAAAASQMSAIVTAASTKAKSVPTVCNSANKKASRSSPAGVEKRNSKSARASNNGSAIAKPSEHNKAWKNKFALDAWDLDEENDDLDSDFDNLFESSKRKRSANNKPKRQSQKLAKVKKSVEGCSPLAAPSDVVATYKAESSSSVQLLSVNWLTKNDCLADVSQGGANEADALVRPTSPSLTSDSDLGAELDEGEDEIGAGRQQEVVEPVRGPVVVKGNSENRRPPTQVRPIEPERVPGWQLKRQRSKRRPLAPALANTSGGSCNIKQLTQPLASPSPRTSGKAKNQSSSSSSACESSRGSSSSSASSTTRSTPTLIDRIGCSIVANLTNLTSGLVSSGAMNCCPTANGGRPALVEVQDRATAANNKSSLAAVQCGAATRLARKQLSRGSLRRQNICAKQGNSLRRPDRRLKLFATPNGCSINRKVHTSIH